MNDSDVNDMSDDATKGNTGSPENLIALYALDALDADDRAKVERYLASDARARALLDDMRETLSILQADAQPVEPSARVKERLFARVDADLASHNLQPQREGVWARIKRLLLAVSPVLAAAAIFLAIGLGVWAVSLQQQLAQVQQQLVQTQQQLTQAQQQFTQAQQQLAQAQPQLVQAQQQLTQTQQQLAQVQQQLVQAQQQLTQTQQQLAQVQQQLVQAQEQLAQAQPQLTLLQAPGLRVASLPKANKAPTTAQVNLLMAPSGSTALLTVSGMNPLASNQTYQFWLLRGGQPIPAGIFNVDTSGTGKLIVHSTEPLGTYDQAGITIEPAGGSAAPNLKSLVSIGNIQ